MCEYCEDVRQTLADDSYGCQEGVEIELSFEDGEPEIVATGFFESGCVCGSASVAINYCPMCGRDLGGDAE